MTGPTEPVDGTIDGVEEAVDLAQSLEEAEPTDAEPSSDIVTSFEEDDDPESMVGDEVDDEEATNSE